MYKYVIMMLVFSCSRTGSLRICHSCANRQNFKDLFHPPTNVVFNVFIQKSSNEVPRINFQ